MVKVWTVKTTCNQFCVMNNKTELARYCCKRIKSIITRACVYFLKIRTIDSHNISTDGYNKTIPKVYIRQK